MIYLGMLLAQIVRFDEKGLPQAIDYRVGNDLRSVTRNLRMTKQIDAGIDGSFTFGDIGLSASGGKQILAIYDVFQTHANSQEVSKN